MQKLQRLQRTGGRRGLLVAFLPATLSGQGLQVWAIRCPSCPAAGCTSYIRKAMYPRDQMRRPWHYGIPDLV
jgi:hypothetical protein